MQVTFTEIQNTWTGPVSLTQNLFDNSFTLPASSKPVSFGEFLLESLCSIRSEQPPRAARWMWTASDPHRSVAWERSSMLSMMQRCSSQHEKVLCHAWRGWKAQFLHSTHHWTRPSLCISGPTAAVSACEQQLGVAQRRFVHKCKPLEEVCRTPEAPAGPDICLLLHGAFMICTNPCVLWISHKSLDSTMITLQFSRFHTLSKTFNN